MAPAANPNAAATVNNFGIFVFIVSSQVICLAKSGEIKTL
jgi:hypothetical protein